MAQAVNIMATSAAFNKHSTNHFRLVTILKRMVEKVQGGKRSPDVTAQPPPSAAAREALTTFYTPHSPSIWSFGDEPRQHSAHYAPEHGHDDDRDEQPRIRHVVTSAHGQGRHRSSSDCCEDYTVM